MNLSDKEEEWISGQSPSDQVSVCIYEVMLTNGACFDLLYYEGQWKAINGKSMNGIQIEGGAVKAFRKERRIVDYRPPVDTDVGITEVFNPYAIREKMGNMHYGERLQDWIDLYKMFDILPKNPAVYFNQHAPKPIIKTWPEDKPATGGWFLAINQKLCMAVPYHFNKYKNEWRVDPNDDFLVKGTEIRWIDHTEAIEPPNIKREVSNERS